jgi:hypothetical protein
MAGTLAVLITHQKPAAVARMVRFWTGVEDCGLFVAYGGPPGHFPEIDHEPKLFISGSRLRTRDHLRERQSYTEIVRAVSAKICGLPYSHIWLMEYDHLPVARDAVRQIRSFAEAEGADLLGFQVKRIDNTHSPHYLSHAFDPEFHTFWNKVSRREDRSVVLSMIGTGSLWRRQVFDEVAQYEEPAPIYLEIYLPTLAHHLGYRVRDVGEQNRFVSSLPRPHFNLEWAREQGAWTIHPLKSAWDSDQISPQQSSLAERLTPR